jgi:hypothetical protein
MRYFLALMVSLLAWPMQSHAADCQALLKQRTSADMQLPLSQFDQSKTEGWRALSLEGCHQEAAVLIERYLEREEGRMRILHFHLAQMHAKSGEYEKAIPQALASLNPREAEQHPRFHWNDYVLATVAFLRHDRASFELSLNNLRQAATIDNTANANNLAVLESMGACFDRPYEEAYGSCKAKP